MTRRLLVLSVAALLLAAVFWSVLERDPEVWTWPLPEDIPAPLVPVDNPMSVTRVELGRWLFYDTRLSGNGSQSCATCHLQTVAFTDAKPRSIGSTGEVHPRGAMSLVNVAYASRLTWANPLLDRLEDQALTPLFGENPVEMGMSGRDAEIAELLQSDPRYAALVLSAFPDDEQPASVLNAVRAIASFVRSIVSYNAPYDRYLAGEENAIPASAERGMDLFFSERVECFHCHGGFNFTDSTTHANTRTERVGFHNNGLYNLNATGDYPADNTGLFDMTGETRDMGKFRAPTLRNIALTAPYMHDGSLQTLEDVVDHYARGGGLTETGPNQGDGRQSPFKSEFVLGFDLTTEEREDLIEFLHTLTDESVLTNPSWSNPHEN